MKETVSKVTIAIVCAFSALMLSGCDPYEDQPDECIDFVYSLIQ